MPGLTVGGVQLAGRALLAPLAGNSIQLPFARELLPPRFHWLLLALPALAAVYFCLMGLIRIREKESWKEMPPERKQSVQKEGFISAGTKKMEPTAGVEPATC